MWCSIAASVLDVATAGGDRPAISTRTRTITYGQLTTEVLTQATNLQLRGCEPQDIVFVVATDPIATITTFLALNLLRCICVPIHPSHSPREMRYLLTRYSATAVVSDERMLGKPSRPSVNTISSAALSSPVSSYVTMPMQSPQDRAAILLTSGARGPAKGVPLTNLNMLADLNGIQEYMAVGSTDVCLVTRSITHASALVAEAFLTLTTGGHVIIYGVPAVARQLFTWCTHHRVTWLGLTPSLLRTMVSSPPVTIASYPRRLVVSGAVLPPALVLSFLETFPHIELLNAYGLTEASPRVAVLMPPFAAVKAGSVGYSISCCQVRVITDDGRDCLPQEQGEIVVQGSNVMYGYVASDAAQPFTADGWLRTGDIGYRDEDGALFVVGRRDDMLIYNGLNIYPEYIASVVEASSYVRRALVALVPLTPEVSRLVAFVEPTRESNSATVLAALRRHLVKSLDVRKHPEEIFIVRRLPLTPSGKPHQQRLVEDFHRHRNSGKRD